MGSQNYFTDCK